MTAPFSFSRQGRTVRAMGILLAIYVVLAGAVIVVDAAWWLMAALALLTLPALWDLWRNPSAGIDLSQDRLDWHTGHRTGGLNHHEIDHMRFDTRWDFSVRVTAILTNGTRVRLPDEALPPHRILEAEFARRVIAVKRHHFRVL